MSSKQIYTGKLEERQTILLEIIYGFSRALEHPTSALLHEHILLCQLKTSKEKLRGLLSYDFEAYMRGPFSNQLRDDLSQLLALGLVEVKKGRLLVTDPGERVIQQDKADANLQSVRAACNEILGEFNTSHAISRAIFDSMAQTPLGGRIPSL